MNKEEIKHFKAMLRQGSLRHMNIILDDKFQKELLNIIKDYEKLQQENAELKRNCNIGNENLKFYKEENTQLKSVNKEIREYIQSQKYFDLNYNPEAPWDWEVPKKDLLQILDKGEQ